MAEDQGKEVEKFDFTSEGEGYISLDEARILAMQTAVALPGDYARDFPMVTMVFSVMESSETDDHYIVKLTVRPQGNFDGTPGQEEFVVGKNGTIALRQVLSFPTKAPNSSAQGTQSPMPKPSQTGSKQRPANTSIEDSEAILGLVVIVIIILIVAGLIFILTFNWD